MLATEDPSEPGADTNGHEEAPHDAQPHANEAAQEPVHEPSRDHAHNHHHDHPHDHHHATQHAVHPAVQEQWPRNERMRHIPTIQTMIQKLDGDLRPRIEKLFAVYTALPHHDPRHAALEHDFRFLCRCIDRVADVAKRPRGQQHPPNDLGNRIGWSISHAVTNLREADLDTFGRRFPYQTFERSNAEPLWAAMLSVIDHLQRIVPKIREIDPQIDERLYEGLVVLREPLRSEPIA